ncbi:MFS general substrate transporter [Thozetella sp. PMI_491]|nr:MFS general substrate transporter [Thozetella sp. PMI_491]
MPSMWKTSCQHNGRNSKELVKSSTDNLDEACSAFQGRGGTLIDDATDKRLLRKIDRYILPIMCLIYGMNYLDKTTLSYSSVMGMIGDLNLQGTNYQWLDSIFYFGYLWPTVRLLQVLPIAKYSALTVITWGVILTLFWVTQNFAGAAALRVLLGIFEATVTPSWTLITSQWYKNFNGVASIMGSFIAYGLSEGGDRGHFSIAPWKILYILMGLLTVALGVVFYAIVPDNQLKSHWLSEEDRIIAVARVRENQQGIGNKRFKRYQFVEAPRIHLLGPPFFSLLIVSFGYTTKQSLLLSAPSGAVEVVTLLFTGWLGDRSKNRLLISLGGVGLAAFGSILLVALSDGAKIGKLIGFYLTPAAYSNFVIIPSLISSNIAGHTKKTTIAAMYLIA